MRQSLSSRIRAWASVAPLLAAVSAPFSVLFDIPALTEPWFIHADPYVLLDPNSANSIADNPASIVLSAVGLGFNICANALLLVRFSVTAGWWRIATRMSIAFWIAKGVIATVNLSVFGPLPPDAKRGEGLWCAVVSLIISGLITFLLLCHWALELTKSGREGDPDNQQLLAIRLAGRHFMLNVTFFVVDLGIFALIASQVENWTYLQGTYFTTVTYLTIGFGDFHPTHTVTRVLLFFFAVVAIAQLGNIIGMLVEFFHSRSAESHAEARRKHERQRREEVSVLGTKPDLGMEMDFLHRLSEREEARTRFIGLVESVAGLLVFWVVGAAIFSQLEGWTYGIGIYFCYVAFLTIGYGDYYPITAAGRVVFVLYSIIAVPIMASFAVQAVQQVFSAASARRYDRTKVRWGLEPSAKQHHHKPTDQMNVVPHAEFVEKWHHEWEAKICRRASAADHVQEKMRGSTENGASAADSECEWEQVLRDQELDEDALLMEQILECALSLEWRARKLLIAHLDADNASGRAEMQTARIVLKADRNVQLHEVKSLLKEIEDSRRRQYDVAPGTAASVLEHVPITRCKTIIQHVLREDPDAMDFPAETDAHETLDQVRRYREDFAGLVAAGSRLMKLKDVERALFERRSL